MNAGARSMPPSRRLRALVVEAAGNLWGSERALLDLIDATASVEFAVCCPPGSRLQPELERRGVRVFPYFIYALHEKSRWQRLRAAFGVARACAHFRPDVVHLNQSGSYRVTLPAASVFRLAVYAHVRLFEDVAYLAKQGGIARRVRGLIAISRAVEDEIRRYPALASVPVHRVYDAYAAATTMTIAGMSEAVARIACVARLAPSKGQDVLVDALGLMKRDGDSVDCLMLGAGSAAFESELRERAARCGAVGSIRWLGFVGEVMPILSTCSVLVFPSHRETLGRVIFEAWDAGVVPIVYGGSGGAAEIVEASGGGLIYHSQDAATLADALRRALRLDAAARERLVAAGRAWMAANCAPREYGRAMASILAGGTQVYSG